MVHSVLLDCPVLGVLHLPLFCVWLSLERWAFPGVYHYSALRPFALLL